MKNDLLKAASEIIEAISKIGSDENTTEHLSVVKSRSKRLLKNASNMLDVETPEFKVGDIVVDDGSYLMMKVDEASNSVVCGKICYNFRYFRVRINFVRETGYIRLATPEEIKEYESALNFYKHGREPFEVKKGDLIRTPSEKITLIWNPENFTKTKFMDCGWEFLKTAEEIDEWLGVADDK